uniref:Uncharacterized protein n=1 Tax=Anopheles funestus TaxID=62324 RepID=A0A182RRD2_ANOFN
MAEMRQLLGEAKKNDSVVLLRHQIESKAEQAKQEINLAHKEARRRDMLAREDNERLLGLLREECANFQELLNHLFGKSGSRGSTGNYNIMSSSTSNSSNIRSRSRINSIVRSSSRSVKSDRRSRVVRFSGNSCRRNNSTNNRSSSSTPSDVGRGLTWSWWRLARDTTGRASIVWESLSYYPTKPWLIKPHINAQGGSPEALFNEQHANARAIIERTFGKKVDFDP